jgi:IPT/TIG domain
MVLRGVLNHIEAEYAQTSTLTALRSEPSVPGSRLSGRSRPGAGHSVGYERFDELFMSVCRIYTHSGMGDFRQLGQARVVNRCAAGLPRHLLTNRKLDPKEDPLKTYSLKRNAIPKLAVLATGLTAAILVATINPTPAQAHVGYTEACDSCHDAGGSVTATPSSATVAPGATYTVDLAFTGGSTPAGFWISGNGVNVTGASSTSATMTAPATAGPYTYTVWVRSGVVASTTYSITVAPAVTTTEPPVGTTEPPVGTTEPPVGTTEPPTSSAAVISGSSPRHGAIGTVVTLAGTGFGELGTVQFGTVVATAKSWTDTKIVFEVPAGTFAKVAHVSVMPGGYKASNAVSFRFDRGQRSHGSFGDHHSRHGVHSGWFGPRHHLLFGGDDD